MTIDQLKTELEVIVKTRVGDYIWLMPEDAQLLLDLLQDVVCGEDAKRLWEMVENPPEPSPHLKALLQDTNSDDS